MVRELKTDKDVIALVKEHFDEAVDARREISAKHKLWKAYYKGDQFAYLDRQKSFVAPTDQQLKEVESKKGVRLLSVNLCRSAVKTIVSFQTKQAPKLFVRPASGQSEARKGTARVGTELMDYQRNRNDFISKNNERALWEDVCGTCYMITYPDYSKHGFRQMPDMEQVQSMQEQPMTDEMGNPMTDEMGQPVMQQMPVMIQQQKVDKDNKPKFVQVPVKTDVGVEIIPPDEWYPAPNVIKVNDLPWTIWAKLAPIDSIKSQFPAAKDLKDDGNPDIQYDLADNLELTYGQKSGLKLLIEYWEKPTTELPRGRHSLICDDLLLIDDEFPYWDTRKDGTQVWGGYRIVKFVFDISMNSHWGMSLLEPAIPLQKYYNSLNSWCKSNILPTASPILAVLKGSMEGIKKLFNLPRVVTFDREGSPPKWVDPPNIPQVILGLMERTKTEFWGIMGIHDTSLGVMPSQRTSGAAMSQNIDIDMGKFGTNFELDEENNRWLGYYILQNYKQFCPERIAEILPPEREEDIRAFLEDDLDDNDVVVERGSSMPENLAGQREMMMNLIQYGGVVLDTPIKQAKFMKGFQTSWGNNYISEATNSLSLAEQENALIMRGICPPVHPNQDHDIHIATHNGGIFDNPAWLLIARAAQQGDPKAVAVSQAADQHNVQHTDYKAQIMAPPPPPMMGAGGPGDPNAPPAGPGPVDTTQELPPELMQQIMAQQAQGGPNV